MGVMIVCCVSAGKAAVEWEGSPAIDIGQSPKDVAVSADGNWIYVLTDEGNISIYSFDGRFEDTIHVGDHVSFLQAGPSNNQLLIGSGKDQTVQVLSLEFIREIDISRAPVLGLSDAPVVITVFMDYQCPYCAQLMPILEDVLEKYTREVKVAYKQFPLRMHQAALSAAAASLVADQAERFWELHARLFDDYRNLTEEKILDMAVTLGFDRDAFQRQMSDPSVLLQIQKDINDGKKAGVSGIPSVFINGRLLKNRTTAGFQELIDQELERLGRLKTADDAP